MRFFRYFPQTMDIDGNIITNLSKKILPSSNLMSQSILFYTYKIDDGERLDTLAKKVYGSEHLQWIILMTNNIMDPRNDLPLSYSEFTGMLKEKYGSVEESMVRVHHYEDEDGVIVDEWTSPSSPVSCYDYEDAINESKREIKIVRPEYVSAFVEELRRILQ